MVTENVLKEARISVLQTEAFWKMETRFIRLNFEAWLEEPKFKARGEIKLFEDLVRAKDMEIGRKFFEEINRR